MTDIKDGGPAFGHGNHEQGGDPGMSLRDYFAGQALAGYCAVREGWDEPASEVSRAAYTIADAMIKERSK